MEMRETDPRVGDWVRVMRGGILVIAVVNYVRPNQWSISTPEFQTDTAGVVQREDIWEIRRAAEHRGA